jgi:hypothetical protein
MVVLNVGGEMQTHTMSDLLTLLCNQMGCGAMVCRLLKVGRRRSEPPTTFG